VNLSASERYSEDEYSSDGKAQDGGQRPTRHDPS